MTSYLLIHDKVRRKDPSTWFWILLDGEPTVIAVCPNGHSATLDHDVASNGDVTPSMVCPHDGCDFHEMVRLEGYHK